MADLVPTDELSRATSSEVGRQVTGRPMSGLSAIIHSIHKSQYPSYSADVVHVISVNKWSSGLRLADTTQCWMP